MGCSVILICMLNNEVTKISIIHQTQILPIISLSLQHIQYSTMACQSLLQEKWRSPPARYRSVIALFCLSCLIVGTPWKKKKLKPGFETAGCWLTSSDQLTAQHGVAAWPVYSRPALASMFWKSRCSFRCHLFIYNQIFTKATQCCFWRFCFLSAPKFGFWQHSLQGLSQAVIHREFVFSFLRLCMICLGSLTMILQLFRLVSGNTADYFRCSVAVAGQGRPGSNA